MFKIDINLCKAIGAEIIGDWSNLKFIDVCFDSRVVQNSSLFIGIKGEKMNGSDFAISAINKGAKGIIVNKKINTDTPQIIINNVLSFVYRYASIKRSEYINKVIAVCGSAGKTTMRSNIVSILPGKVLYTRRSFNLKLSICCTLLLLDNDVDYLVIECGTDFPREMDGLGRLLYPDYTIFATIGEEHMANFANDINNIYLEQASIVNYTNEKVIADREFVDFIANNSPFESRCMAHDLCTIDKNNNTISYNNKVYHIKPTTEKLINTMAKIILLMDSLGIKYDPHMILNLNRICMRGNEIITPKGIIYDFSYNCNQTSLENTLSQINEPCDFIYGKMFDATEQNNINAINAILANKFIRNIYTFGIEFSLPRCIVWQNEYMDNILPSVYIMGSKSNHLISIVTEMINRRCGQKPIAIPLKNL